MFIIAGPFYSQAVFEDLKDVSDIKIGGRNINNIRFADDTGLIAENEENLQMLLDKLVGSCRKWELIINSDKTVSMLVQKGKHRRNWEIRIDDINIKKVKEYNYLGCKISDDVEGKYKEG